MKTTIDFPVVRLHRLPASLPGEGGVSLELQEGIPILKAAPTVQERIEHLLRKQQQQSLSAPEQDELESYEELDDYLSLLNRITRNLYTESQNN
jgi:hypothetical protein